MADYYEGRVHTVIYDDPSKGFYILKMVLDGETDHIDKLFGSGGSAAVGYDDPSGSVTVKGNIPGLSVGVGTWFGFEAHWVNTNKYGQQLQITKAPVLKGGWDPDNAAKMLASNGVSEYVVEQIREHWGDARFIEVLGKEDMIREVPGLSKFSAAQVVQRWESTQAYFQTLNFLGEMGLPAARVKEIWRTFGDEAEGVLTKNPWALCQVEGFKFSQADEIARKLSLDMKDPRRIEGAIMYVMKNELTMGHMFLTSAPLFRALTDLLKEVDQKEVGKALVVLHKQGLLVLDRKTRPGMMAIYEPWPYELETESAQLLAERAKTASLEDQDHSAYLTALTQVGPQTEKVKTDGGDLTDVCRAAVEEWSSQTRMALSVDQKEGVLNALKYPVSVLTGLPGTGKTTSLRAAVRILQDAEVPFLLCAPTGIAAKRLEAVTGSKAYTIHRAFGAQGASDEQREFTYAGIVGDSDGGATLSGQGEQWQFHKENPHPAKVVIVDESSMIDQHLLYRLLTCTGEDTRLVFVGDHAQLPSVGPGNVLRDMINSECFPVIKLVTIFRQEDTSGIVGAAHDIVRGKVPKVSTSGDFVLLEKSNDDEVKDLVIKLARLMYQKRKEFQILSPRHGGVVGVTALNELLRERLNPKQGGLAEYRMGKDVIRQDDRIMVVKNDYRLGVFNGDVGKVNHIDRVNKEIEVKIFGEPPMLVRIDFRKVPKLLRLAYACTVHKAQGLEYDHIIIPVVESFHQQLQRNLYYTAVTRARKKVILVGTRTAFAKAVFNAKEDSRNTLFLDRLRGLMVPSGEYPSLTTGETP